MQFSSFQEAIFQFGRTGTGHGGVQAVAGSGKTTTGVELISQFPMTQTTLFTSFTNVIVDATSQKLKARGLLQCQALTFNKFGSRVCFSNIKSKFMEDQKTKTLMKFDYFDMRRDQAIYRKVFPATNRLISLFKALAITSWREAEKQFESILDYYAVEVPRGMKLGDFQKIVLDVWRLVLQRSDLMDFDDQKFFPILYDWDVPQFDNLIIDEYQDSCPVEAELMLRSCKSGRVIIFGDKHQAIYSFKGTKPAAMSDFVTKFQATELPLSICYRCPKLVIEEAQQIVPEIQAAPDAIDGVVDTINKDDFFKQVRSEDLVLSRTTEDLVKSVIKLIQQGRSAYVKGAEYGDRLQYFIDNVLQNSTDYTAIEEFLRQLNEYYVAELEILTKAEKDNLIQALESKVETLKILAERDCNNIMDLRHKIKRIFGNSGQGICHMTIHKSKGLESHAGANTYILRPDKLPHPRIRKEHLIEEEKRLKYVAITRARGGLFWVLKDKDEK